MPISPLVMQRRSYQIGRLRTGTSVAVPGKDWRRPVRLEHFRFTTPSEPTASAVAAHYGGDVAIWEGHGEFEVLTGLAAIDVLVPPREVISQWMELWQGGRCKRRCDGITESVSRQPCLCPQPDDPLDETSVLQARDERMRLGEANPPQACKQKTRVNIMLPDLPGLGVWRLDTGSYHATVEMGDTAEALTIARDAGVYLTAVVRIEQRKRASDGKPYPVVALQPGCSLRQIASGALPAGAGGLLAQLQGQSAGDRLALPAGPASAPAPAPDEPEEEDWQKATRIYERARAATTTRAVEACKDDAEHQGLLEEHVCSDRANDVWEPLEDALREVWKQKAKRGAA